jgi:hypothetical protein
MLVDVFELNYVDAARALGVPVGTLKSRLARARACLRSRLHHKPDGLPFSLTQSKKGTRPNFQFPLRSLMADD